MPDMFKAILACFRAISRFRWLGILVAVLVSTAGWATVANMDDYYVANARVFVDSNRVLKPLLKGIAVQPDVNQRVSLMSRTLLNRPNLEKLVRMTDMDVEATTPLEKEKLIDKVARNMRLNGTRGNSSLYTVSYSNKDSDMARNMVQSMITVFVESTIGDERQDSESAQQFLGQQVIEYEQRLADADRRLSKFKRDNAGKMPSEAGTYVQRLELLKGQSRNVQLELGEAQSKKVTLENRLAAEPRVLTERISSSDQGESFTAIQLSEQQQELSSLSARYTDKHPKIAQLRSSIAILEEQLLAESASGPQSRAVLNTVVNPAYQELSRLLAETDGRIAELEVRSTAFKEQVEELSKTVESIPLVEATLKQLDRDYLVVKTQYEELLTRRESAQLSQQVEQNVDDVKFRVIDPPFVPSSPSGPNKAMLSAGTFVVAIGLATGLAILLSILFPVFYEPENIAARSGYSVLGTVSLLDNKRQSFFEMLSWATIISILALLTLICAFLVLFYAGWIGDHHFDRLAQSRIGPYIEQVRWTVSGWSNKLQQLM